MLSYSLGYSVTKGHDDRTGVMASYLVGRTGFEPVTSSVSGKRAPAAPTARDVRYAGYDGQLCASRRDYQKFAPTPIEYFAAWLFSTRD